DPHRRQPVGLPLGRRAQARAARSRGRPGSHPRRWRPPRGPIVTALARARPPAPSIPQGAQPPAPASLRSVEDRVAAVDAARLARELDAQGAAVVEQLLTADECHALAALYPGDGFRSRVVMAAHGFGRGEYQYFAYPLPPLVAELRACWYPRLAPI